jgi:hypothetical protein
MIESELWQLYRTGDENKMDRLFNALADECDNDDVERAIQKAWGEYE